MALGVRTMLACAKASALPRDTIWIGLEELPGFTKFQGRALRKVIAQEPKAGLAKRGPSLVDWNLLMTYGVLLREAGYLPSKHASLTANLKALAKLLFRVDADEADLRRLTHDIYAGRRKRRKRKRER